MIILSRFAKSYLIDDKTSNTVLSKIKDFINVVEKSQIIHTENGTEFPAKNLILFCQEQKIKIIRGGIGHPRSQGAVEKLNKTIISKLKYIKFEDKDKFNVIERLNKDINIYNNIPLSVIKIEPGKALHLRKKDLNRIIND